MVVAAQRAGAVRSVRPAMEDARRTCVPATVSIALVDESSRELDMERSRIIGWKRALLFAWRNLEVSSAVSFPLRTKWADPASQQPGMLAPEAGKVRPA